MDKKRNKIYVIAFAVLFFGLTIFAWLKPADDFSTTERRPLDQVPTLNAETIFSGKFMSEFEEYTLDQFPLRDTFRSLKAMMHLYVFGQADNNDVYIADLLTLEDFYVTDTHWKQENIQDVAVALGNAMGTPLKEEYEKVALDVPFYGVYYGQLGLPIHPDAISYLNHPMFADCIITNHENGKQIPMYSMEKAEDRDPYEMFLSGSLAVITIENPAATTEKELVIFRDSFGSSLTPLLVEGYQKITILDARYLNEGMIGNFVTFEGQDVLFIHSSSVINNETAFK